MRLPDIASARLMSQQIASAKFTKAKDIVAYMGAVQAQDYAMSKWAIGLRIPGSTEKQIEKALDKGDIIRTHVLRPTWHIIPAADIYWMLSLSAGKIKALMKTMDKQLELTEKVFTKSNNIITKCAEAGKHVDRDIIGDCLEKAGIHLGKNRLSHLLVRAELDEIICSGKTVAGKKTYTLLADRVPKKKLFSKDESLGMLAKKYFASHGPACVEDFSWWSGLTLSDARQGFETVRSNFITEKIGGFTYIFNDEVKFPAKTTSSVYLLPAYDEFIISYKNRTAALATEHQKKVFTVNGIFHPVVVVNGQVTGLWKRNFQKDRVDIETRFFQSHNKAIKDRIEEKAATLGFFLEKQVSVSYGNAYPKK
jgi:Winged helix DNA-binding domain